MEVARSARIGARRTSGTGRSSTLGEHREERRMKAAVYHGALKPLTIEEIEIAEPVDREVLVRTVASGVCHSDLHYVDRPSADLGQIGVLGHEAAGVVEAVGPNVTEFAPGDHVIACLSVFCGKCEYCLVGRTNLCIARPARAGTDAPRLSWNSQPLLQFAHIGAYAEQMLLHENSIVKITKEMPLDRAALISCGVITGAGAVLNRAKVAAGSTVAVFGVGGVGMSAIQGARIAGARRIIAVDLLEYKLMRAREFGATDTVNASEGDPVEAIRELTNGGVDYAFEAIGLSETAAQAFEATRDGGEAVMLGVAEPGAMVSVPAAALRREKILTGSSMGSNRFKVDMPKLVDLYFQGKLMLDEMITNRLPLDEVNTAFEELRQGSLMRSVLVFEN
jgi:S-(hydroxymethyl)glutathione dehydrogenase / alcohol dehydrogenase